MTDHRAIAQSWLEDIREQGDSYDPYSRTDMALIALVHALLALGAEPSAPSQRSQEARQTPQKVGDVTTDPHWLPQQHRPNPDQQPPTQQQAQNQVADQ